MTTPSDIKSYFHLNRKEFDGEIFIQIQSSDSQLCRTLMNSICFDTSDPSIQFEALPEEKNTTTLARRIFVRKTKDDLKK